MTEIEDAVRIIFDNHIFSDFKLSLKGLTEDDLKKAYRNKAKMTHPDRAAFLGKSLIELECDFKKVTKAYSVLMEYYNKNIRNAAVFERKTERSENVQSRPERNYKDDNRRKDFMYSFEIPNRVLRFSEFLFYKRVISWNQLIESIVYQAKVRPKIGEIAVSLEYIDNLQLAKILSGMFPNEKFGEAAMRMGFIDLYKLYVLLGNQKKYDAPIGRYFIDKKILSTIELMKLLEENKLWNKRF